MFKTRFIFLLLAISSHGYYNPRDVNGLKKKKKEIHDKTMNLKIMQNSLQYLIVCPYYKHF